MYRNNLKDIKEKIVSLCLMVILAMTALPGCKNLSVSTVEKSLPDMPMEAPRENSLAWEVSQKPAIESRLLSDMESLGNWELSVDKSANPRSYRTYGTISLSNDKFHKGRASVLLTSPQGTSKIWI